LRNLIYKLIKVESVYKFKVRAILTPGLLLSHADKLSRLDNVPNTEFHTEFKPFLGTIPDGDYCWVHKSFKHFVNLRLHGRLTPIDSYKDSISAYKSGLGRKSIEGPFQLYQIN